MSATWKTIYSITASTTLSMLLVACDETVTIESSLLTAQSIISDSNSNNPTNYQLSYDADFPCKVSIQEDWLKKGTRWQQTYRFDLTDIQVNTFLQSKDGRRAIAYSGFKVFDDGTKKEFSEIRVNNFQFRSSLNEDEQQKLKVALNQAITFCEEEYLF